MYELHNVRMGRRNNGRKHPDTWILYGEIHGHESITSGHIVTPTYPTAFDEKNLTITTVRGSIYKILSFSGNRIQTIEAIKEALANKGWCECE